MWTRLTMVAIRPRIAAPPGPLPLTRIAVSSSRNGDIVLSAIILLALAVLACLNHFYVDSLSRPGRIALPVLCCESITVLQRPISGT
jgi:hypothetical protein